MVGQFDSRNGSRVRESLATCKELDATHNALENAASRRDNYKMAIAKWTLQLSEPISVVELNNFWRQLSRVGLNCDIDWLGEKKSLCSC